MCDTLIRTICLTRDVHRSACDSFILNSMFPSRCFCDIHLQVHANDEGEISGYMNVQNKKKQWEQYWFVIKDKVLYRYKACEDTSAIGKGFQGKYLLM